MTTAQPALTPRERFARVLRFEPVDRVPLEPGNGRESTRARWLREGLPREAGNIAEYAYRCAGGTQPWPRGGPGFPVDQRMIPLFEEKVLERKPASQIVQDWKGNICEIGLEFTVDHLRSATDFVTRRWIKCPVESRADWEAMKTRYRADDPARLPPDAAALGRRLADREHVVGLSVSGPFWQLREWLGFEALCVLFHDDPDWVREMIAFWREFVAGLLERTLGCLALDFVHVSEDMAYKEHAMISPAMAREFLWPVYQAWGEILRDARCPVYALDSDGYVGDLIPVWLDAGIQVCDPMEVAAGNDLFAYRRRYGRRLAFRGGVDKRLIARGGAALEAEIARLEPLIREGGYIPGCDHGVPADVSWENFVHYVGLLARATGWL